MTGDARGTAPLEPQLDANRANSTWRLWVSNHPIAAALLSGFVATHIATIIGYFFGGVGLPQFIWPIVNGRVVLPKGSPTEQFVIGEVLGSTAWCSP